MTDNREPKPSRARRPERQQQVDQLRRQPHASPSPADAYWISSVYGGGNVISRLAPHRNHGPAASFELHDLPHPVFQHALSSFTTAAQGAPPPRLPGDLHLAQARHASRRHRYPGAMASMRAGESYGMRAQHPHARLPTRSAHDAARNFDDPARQGDALAAVRPSDTPADSLCRSPASGSPHETARASLAGRS